MLICEKPSGNQKYRHASTWSGVGLGEEEKKGTVVIGVSNWEK